MLHISERLPEAERALRAGRRAARRWAQQPVSARLKIVRRARHLLARRAEAIAATVTHRALRDTLVSEVLPLLDAMRFLERRATALLATRRLHRGRPLWLFGVAAEIERVPLGVVLILGPGNFPLFLPCVQALQALVAGNAVCLKPAPGGEAAAAAVAACLHEAGLPEDVLQLLEANGGPAAVACGFDHIVLTGSAQTGIDVLKASAPCLTPATMELSGCDAAYVMAGADVAQVARCLAYGLALNGGATCIAPRRVFVVRDLAVALERALLALLPRIRGSAASLPVARQLAVLLEDAARAGGRVLRSAPDGPVILADARSDMLLLQRDLFAAWLAIVPVEDMTSALRQSRRCAYALGASVFGPRRAARQFARQVNAGSVCINDVIVPTADPRLPFGGGGRSGFGRTRGAEGLLQMTAAKAVSVRKGRFMPHLAAVQPGDAARFALLIRLLHGDYLGERLARITAGRRR
jgi:acyl-CoA reductase-like NAD-dependent aldehyde dehydrogenase